MATKPFPIAMPDDLLAEVRRAARETGLSQADVVRQSVKAGIPKIREQYRASKGRVTNVKPLSRRQWERIYSRRDELDGVSGRELAAFQSREEPS
jgi:hypothetical protein